MSREKHRMKLKEHFIIHKTDLETILVPSEGTDFSGIVKGNSVLGDILVMLKEYTTEEDIVRAMEDIYDAPEGLIGRDVARALSELRSIGALDE